MRGYGQARSQDLEKEIQSDFLAEIRNSKLFSAQNKVIFKKKKKKKVFAKIQSNFLSEIRNSKLFSAQNKVISKKRKKEKKKRSSPKLWLLFRPISQIQSFEGGCFRMGGAIFHFSQKIGLKSTKSMRFCILHKPMGGGSSPPRPPPLATLLGMEDHNGRSGDEEELCKNGTKVAE